MDRKNTQETRSTVLRPHKKFVRRDPVGRKRIFPAPFLSCTAMKSLCANTRATQENNKSTSTTIRGIKLVLKSRKWRLGAMTNSVWGTGISKSIVLLNLQKENQIATSNQESFPSLFPLSTNAITFTQNVSAPITFYFLLSSFIYFNTGDIYCRQILTIFTQSDSIYLTQYTKQQLIRNFLINYAQ